MKSLIVPLAAVLSAGLLAAPVQAQLLGNSDSNGLVTLGSGEAGSGGLVNLGIGGGDGNVLDLNLLPGGNGGNLGNARVTAGGGSGGIGADIDLLDNNVRANANVGGGSTLGLDISIGGGGSGGNGNNGNDGGGNSGGNGPGGNNGGGNNGGPGFVGTASASGSGGPLGCNTIDPGQVAQLLQNTSVGGWHRASNIQIVPAQVCQDQRRQLSAQLSGNPVYGRMIQAVFADSLVTAALARSKYRANDVFAVQQSGNQLTVYVY